MSRAKQRENRRVKSYETKLGIREEKLDLIDHCGIKDPTPYEAVRNIIRKERTAIRSKAAAASIATASTATTAIA